MIARRKRERAAWWAGVEEVRHEAGMKQETQKIGTGWEQEWLKVNRRRKSFFKLRGNLADGAATKISPRFEKLFFPSRVT